MAIYRGKGGKTDVVPADGDQEFAGSIIAEKDIHAHGNISADGDITVGGDIIWEGTITGEIDTSNKSAMSWIRWSHDCMCRGQIQQAKEMLRKGLELASDHSKQDGG